MSDANEQAGPAAMESVPAGGAGADSGAVDAVWIDEDDRARLPNISSQNDVTGVGTRAADGSVESALEDERTPEPDDTADPG